MDKLLLKQIIKEFQELKIPLIYPRDIEIPLDSRKIIAISGPRRSGKTFLLFEQIKKLLNQKVSRERILYINFDDPRLLPFSAKEMEDLLEAYFELYPFLKDETNFAFFDEIQNVKDWERSIRRIYDSRNFRIFLTGSSSKFLSKEIATSLRGRAINYELLPFSFKEILLTQGIQVTDDIFYSKTRFVVKKLLSQYFKEGGFPEVVLEKNKEIKIRILKEYLETMFFKDLVERFNIKNQSVLREMLKYLISNISSLFSLNAFWQWLKQSYPVSKKTLINYSSFLEEIGLFFLIRKFSFSLKEQIQTQRKVYLVDNGLRTVYGFRFSEDRGKILENSVFLKLKHNQTKNPLMEIFYWRDYQGKEIDFVVKEGKKIKQLIQVCADPEDFRIRKREINSLLKAGKELRCGNLLLITEDLEKIEKVGRQKIIFKPLWQFALDKSV